MNHSEMVKALAKNGETIAAEIDGADAHLLHMAVGVSGEAGELLDAIKKLEANIAKLLGKRYKDGKYSDQAAQERADKAGEDA